MSEDQGPILYVLVIGFHHKKGCQVEFSFPPLVPGYPNECPSGWKYLPTLALPDGSHNYDEDTVFFHLPSLTLPRKTIYGVSCYRQIPVEKIKNLTSDITRGTVQKSVCVLSTIPLYGYIQVKMSLITHAYFDEGDFSKVSLLEDTYHHLNSVLLQNDLSLQTYVGYYLQMCLNGESMVKMSTVQKHLVAPGDDVQTSKMGNLRLYVIRPNPNSFVAASRYPNPSKLALTEAVHKVCRRENILTWRLSRPMSPMPNFSDEDITPECSPKHIPIKRDLNDTLVDNNVVPDTLVITNSSSENEDKRESAIQNGSENKENKCNELNRRLDLTECDDAGKNMERSSEIGLELTESVGSDLNTTDAIETDDDRGDLCRESSADTLTDANVQSNMTYLAQIKNENCGCPLSIFNQGYLCLPYLSLPYMDLLSDVNVRGYVVGATNVLFKQKRQLYDILVDMDAGRIECHDLELRKQLHLTTEDLRFADYIVKHVSEERHDVFLDGVGWDGGDEWIRTQFKIYLLCLLRTSMLQDGCREFDHFNSNFMSSWKDTYNYKMWNSLDCSGILEVNPGHPFSGQLSVADMKLRLSHTMQNTESGRKLNQAMASTGRAVATTSKAVGGALSQAKGAFSSWWSNLLVSPDPVQKGVESLNGNSNTGVISESKSESSADLTLDIPHDKNDNANGFLVREISEENKSTHNKNLNTDCKPGEIHLV